MGGKLNFGTGLRDERADAASAPPHHDSMKLKKIASTIVTAAPESEECFQE